MSTPKEVLHVYTNKSKLCEARPGDPPIMVPKSGITCPECKLRDAVFQAKHAGWQEREREHIEKLEAGWAEQDRKKGVGS